MEIQLREAYDEACRALGESIVRERLLSRMIQTATAGVPNDSSGAPPEADGSSDRTFTPQS